jgi:nucleotide-binding universal stress UspA family protein
MKPTRGILYPTDLSPASARVLEKASRFARASRATLLIVHVLSPGTPEPFATEPHGRGAESVIDRSAHGRAKRRLDRSVATAGRAGIRAAGLLLEGRPADEIVQAAKSNHMDLIVMRTPGRRRAALSRLLFDRVTDQVIAHAPCPVLTFHDTRRSRRVAVRGQALRAG